MGSILPDTTRVPALRPNDRSNEPELRTGSVNPLTGDIMNESLITTLKAPTPSFDGLGRVHPRRREGDPVEFDVAGSPDHATIVTSPELDIVASISGHDTCSTLTVGGPDLAAKPIVQIDADWRTGATQPPDISEVLALDLS